MSDQIPVQNMDITEPEVERSIENNNSKETEISGPNPKLVMEVEDPMSKSTDPVAVSESETGAAGAAAEQEPSSSSQLTLQTIPNEMFLHICSFIDAGFVIRTLSLVSKQFYEILSNEQTWKIRQTKRWGKNGVYPPVPIDENEFPWSRACVKREEQIKLWGNDGSNLRNVELRSHIGCVDAVHLFEGGQYLASGSRDRTIVIWDVEKCFSGVVDTNAEPNTPKIAPDSAKIDTKAQAHIGWIWAFASNPSYLFSAGWDRKVRIWDRKSNFQSVSEFGTQSACLSISAMEHLVACGTFDKKVLLFDPRVSSGDSFSAISSYSPHPAPVLALSMDETRIITCGEEGRCVDYDLRAGKVRKSFLLPNKAYPTCLSFRREDPAPHFYVGDKSGNLHLIDSRTFSLVETYSSIGHSRGINAVFHGLGSVFTCSRDGNMKIFEPSRGLKPLASYKINSELPGVHSLNNIVALADSDGVVRLWSPVEGF